MLLINSPQRVENSLQRRTLNSEMNKVYFCHSESYARYNEFTGENS